MLARNNINELTNISQQAIVLKYAKHQVGIWEQSEDELLSDLYNEIRESAKTDMRAGGGWK